MRWESFVGGILALTLLEVVLAPDANGNYAAAGRAGGALSLLASVIEHVLSPAFPLIPDHSGSSSTSAGSSSSAVVTTPHQNPVLSA